MIALPAVGVAAPGPVSLSQTGTGPTQVVAAIVNNATPFILHAAVGADIFTIQPYSADVVEYAGLVTALALTALQAPSGPATAVGQSYVQLTALQEASELPPPAAYPASLTAQEVAATLSNPQTILLPMTIETIPAGGTFVVVLPVDVNVRAVSLILGPGSTSPVSGTVFGASTGANYLPGGFLVDVGAAKQQQSCQVFPTLDPTIQVQVTGTPGDTFSLGVVSNDDVTVVQTGSQPTCIYNSLTKQSLAPGASVALLTNTEPGFQTIVWAELAGITPATAGSYRAYIRRGGTIPGNTVALNLVPSTAGSVVFAPPKGAALLGAGINLNLVADAGNPANIELFASVLTTNLRPA